MSESKAELEGLTPFQKQIHDMKLRIPGNEGLQNIKDVTKLGLTEEDFFNSRYKGVLEEAIKIFKENELDQLVKQDNENRARVAELSKGLIEARDGEVIKLQQSADDKSVRAFYAFMGNRVNSIEIHLTDCLKSDLVDDWDFTNKALNKEHQYTFGTE